MKGLEALENIKREAGIPYFSTLYDIDMWREDFATVEKELKAFEIIKINMPNLTLLGSCKTYKRYIELSGDNLTREEYDLLKEVLL